MAFVTPEQAKKMRCCKPEFVQCKADECMGWRWKPRQTRFVEEGKMVPEGWVVYADEWGDKNIDDVMDKKKYIEYEKIETVKSGYCGIAGYVSTDD